MYCGPHGALKIFSTSETEINAPSVLHVLPCRFLYPALILVKAPKKRYSWKNITDKTEKRMVNSKVCKLIFAFHLVVALLF